MTEDEIGPMPIRLTVEPDQVRRLIAAQFPQWAHRLRQALDRSDHRSRLTAIWQEALAAPWHGDPVWCHGDFYPNNLLLRDGRLSAVIDFGGCGVGDPACDLAVAWTMLDAPARKVFRDRLGCDDAMWARGRGWALWKSVADGDLPTVERVVEP